MPTVITRSLRNADGPSLSLFLCYHPGIDCFPKMPILQAFSGQMSLKDPFLLVLNLFQGQSKIIWGLLISKAAHFMPCLEPAVHRQCFRCHTNTKELYLIPQFLFLDAHLDSAVFAQIKAFVLK